MTAHAGRPDDAVRIVERFFDALTDLDVDRAVTFLTPDIVWQNTGLPTVRGLARATRVLRFANRPGCRFEAVVHHIVGDDTTVMVERTDLLTVGPVRSRFWVCGTFELRDGRIAVWRDRYDVSTVAAGTVAATVGALRDRVRRR